MHWITSLPEISLYGYFEGFATIKEPWSPSKCMRGRFMSLAECKRLGLFKDWNELGSWHWKRNDMVVFINKETGGCYPEKFIEAWMHMPVRYSETDNDTVELKINGRSFYVELPEMPEEDIMKLDILKCSVDQVQNIMKKWYEDRRLEIENVVRKGLEE